LIHVKETFKSAKPAYLIVDSGELILLNSTSDPYAMIATIESKKAKEKSFSFISGGHKGDVVAPVGAFIGLIIGK